MRALALLTAAAALVGCSGAAPPPGPTATAPGSSTALSVPHGPPVADNWTQYHGSADRNGVSTALPAPRRLRVAASLKLDGSVYAAPVSDGAHTFVATENDTVYGLDTSLQQRWKRHLGSPARSSELPCGNIDPLGITGTPVVADGLIWVAAEFGNPVRHRLFALDTATGAIRRDVTLDLPGVETRAMQQRGALARSGGRVWVPFGGLAGDCGGYKGRVVGVPVDPTGNRVSYTVPTTREAGIWTPPGPSVDAHGNLFVAVGNGESGPGDPYDHSDSVLKLGTDGQLLDSFSPTTWATDNQSDLDLGSQGPALVGTKWVFSAGKSGSGYVLRQDHLGGIGGQVSKAEICHSYGGTAVDGNVVYVPCDDGVRAVRIDGAGTMHMRWHAAPAGSPVVGGGRVWALDPGTGTLHALDPSTGKTREQIAVGAVSRFATPMISGAELVVPTLAGITVVAVQ